MRIPIGRVAQAPISAFRIVFGAVGELRVGFIGFDKLLLASVAYAIHTEHSIEDVVRTHRMCSMHDVPARTRLMEIDHAIPIEIEWR